MLERNIKQAVLDDYKKVVGKVVWTHAITAYVGDTCHQVNLDFQKPIRVRVLPDQDEASLLHDTGSHIDPYWDVEIIDKNRPELPSYNLRGVYIFGVSYDKRTGKPDEDIKLETFGQKLGRWFRKLKCLSITIKD